MSAITAPGSGTPVPSGLGQLDGARFDPARTEGAGLADTIRSLKTSLLLGWRIESNWTDPTLFVIYTVAKPVASLLLLVVMIQIIGGAASEATRTFVILGSALWATVIAGIQGPAWSVLDDRERYRMLKYLAVSPARLLVLLVGRGGARLAAGTMGTSVALVFSVIFLGLRIDLWAVHWPYLVTVLLVGIVPVVAIGVVLAAICLQTRQESWSYPEAVAGAMFLVTGVVFPLAVLPDPVEVLGLINPITWWVEGVRRALVPDGAVVDRRRGVGVDGCHRNLRAGRRGGHRRLVADRGARYTRGDRDLPVERASRPRAGPPRPDYRLVTRRTAAGSERRRSEGAAMRIYEGSPRQDFEEVFRSIGAFIDSHGMRDILLLEVPDGFIVQGLVSAGGTSGSAWSETVGTITKETLSFLDDDIAKFMEEAAARRASGVAASDKGGTYERGLRVIGHWMDTQHPKDVFLFEQGGSYVVRVHVAGQAGSHHELAEFTNDDVEHLVTEGPALRVPPKPTTVSWSETSG